MYQPSSLPNKFAQYDLVSSPGDVSSLDDLFSGSLGPLVQGTSTKRPVKDAGGLIFDHYLPCYMQSTNSFAWPDNFTVFIVCQPQYDTGSDQSIISHRNGTTEYFTVGITSNAFFVEIKEADNVETVALSGPTVSYNKLYCLAIKGSVGGTIELWVDGVLYDSDTNVTDGLANSDILHVGVEDDDEANPFQGFIKNITVYSAEMLNNDVVQASSYLMAKYPASNTRVFDERQIRDAIAWLDAYDPSTITADGNNKISQWDNKGTGDDFVQATESSQPTYVSDGLNGGPVSRFPAGGSRVTATIPFTEDVFTTISLGVMSSTTTYYSVSQVWGGAPHKKYWHRWESSTGRIFVFFSDDGTAQASTSDPLTINDGDTTLISARADCPNQELLFRYGGATQATNSTPYTTLNDSGNNLMKIGPDASTATGDIAEFVFIPRVLPLGEIVEIEAYMLRKWGV